MASKALIIGAGIAGPALAMFLRRAGIEATIYEARTKPQDSDGAFLSVAPNGLSVLASLSIADSVTAAGFLCPRMVMWSGERRLGQFGSESGSHDTAASVVMRRSTLHETLLNEAKSREIPLITGKKLVEAIDEGSQVTARFADGSEAAGDVLIGCDGIHSRTRRFVDSTVIARYRGKINFAGASPRGEIPPARGTQNMVFGRYGFFGYLQNPSDQVWWFSNLSMPKEPETGPGDEHWKHRLTETFRTDPAFIADLIATTETRLDVHPIYELPELPRWQRGRVVVAGDAAHAMPPNAGQGASQALEDAAVLSQCLRDIPDVPTALVRFQEVRHARVRKVARQAARNSDHGAPPNAFARGVRDVALTAILKIFGNAQSPSGVHAHRIDWKAPVTP